jgi:hypothetical protein
MALEFLSHLGATDQLWRNVQNTPAVVVDLDVVEKKLHRGAEFTRSQGLILARVSRRAKYRSWHRRSCNWEPVRSQRGRFQKPK